MRKVLLVHAVHLGKILHVCEEDGGLQTDQFPDSAARSFEDGRYLDDFANVAAGFLENGLETLARSLCLVGDAALDQVAVLVGGDLARDEDVLADLDCLALGHWVRI